MSAMDDVFGPFPDRPNHPDFWKLSEIVLMLDGRMDDSSDKSQTFLDIVSSVVDPDSLIYMATQRALRSIGPNLDRTIFAKVVAMYMDGFIAGAHLGKRET